MKNPLKSFNLTTSLYPQLLNRFVFNTTQKKIDLTNKTIHNLKTNFKILLKENQWLSEQVKTTALNKLSLISRVVGNLPETDNYNDFEALFRFVKLQNTFSETLVSVLRNAHLGSLRTLFAGNAEYVMRTALMDPDAAPHVRDNRLLVDPGLVQPAFVKDALQDFEELAGFGFAAAREIARVANGFFRCIWGSMCF